MTLAALGSILKDKREALDLSVDDISERIKVSMRIIKLIEDGNETGLPHSVYTRGFIISYAEVLEMDKDELLTHLDRIFPSEDIEEMQPAPQIISPNQRRGVRLKQFIMFVFLLAIIGGIAFGAWFVVNNFGDDIVDLVKKPFAASTTQQNIPPAAVEQTASSTTPQTDDGSSLSSTASRSLAETSAMEGQSEAQAPQTEVDPAGDSLVTLPQSPSQEASADVTEGRAVAQNLEENVVIISARAACWTRITADKKQIFEKTITPGNNYTFTYAQNATILLGNPSAVSLTINGEPYTGNLRSSQTLTINLPL